MKCEICGNKFKPIHGNSKYCSKRCKLISNEISIMKHKRGISDEYIKENINNRLSLLYNFINK